MRILIGSFNTPQFIVDAGRRFTYMFSLVEGEWVKSGGHLWAQGSPSVPFSQHIYLNPNTGEKRGSWVDVFNTHFKYETPSEFLSEEWAADCWQAAMKTATNPNPEITEADKTAFLNWEKEGGLTIDTEGISYLYCRYEEISIDVGAYQRVIDKYIN